jgi:dihydroorotate dehydrogenase subfamily 2
LIYPIARWLLFKLDPERAHHLTLAALQAASRLRLLAQPAASPTESVELLGLRFANRIGLAAGFDKDARYVDALSQLGFGFIEVGTITPLAQAGQARPRVLRLPRASGLINRMGFPNDGASAAATRLARRTYRGICGVNIGKNLVTSIDAAAHDYVAAFERVAPHADYIAINVSSPNTARLRELQQVEHLARICEALLTSREQCERRYGRRPPLLLKLAPDQSAQELLAVLRVLRAHALDGVIATNTTVTRPVSLARAPLEGGLSGAPLLSLALTTVQIARQELGPAVPIIGVGGIGSAADARQMLSAGADLIQIYTGLVYRGPALVNELRQASLAHFAAADQRAAD